MLNDGILVTASNAFLTTKKLCKAGTVNLHKLIGRLRDDGHKIDDYWADGHTHKIFEIKKRNRKFRKK